MTCINRYRFLLCTLLATFFLLTAGSSGRVYGGGYYICRQEHDKLRMVEQASLQLWLPLGKFGKNGREAGAGFARMGAALDIEGLWYTGKDEGHIRFGAGLSLTGFFFTMDINALNGQLQHAFDKDSVSHTQFTNPGTRLYMGMALGGEMSVLYRMNRFSLEATARAGPLWLNPPGYQPSGGSYVPPEYSHLFLDATSTRSSGVGAYMHTGLNLNYFVSPHVGLFAGAGFNYAKPRFKTETINLEMENNTLILHRQPNIIKQEMMFMNIQVGVIFHIHG